MIASHDVLDHQGTTSLLGRCDEALRRAGLGRNLLEGRVRIIQAVMAKPRAEEATLARPLPQPAAVPLEAFE
jgi:hypothetical protein